MVKIVLASILAVCTNTAVSAALPDLGPPAGTIAKVGIADAAGTANIYKTQKVWEDLHHGQYPAWDNPNFSIIEAGSIVKITKRSTYEDAAWFLSQVRVLSGRHNGETWWC
ncbi:hypothetical protein BH11CYA1_BH11CYA1_16560 [soil metagenome]